MTLTQKSEGFDRVFDLVGGHGWFQWRLLLIISLQLIIVTFHHIGYVFLGAIPSSYWCEVEELQTTNWTVEQIKKISIPLKEDPNSPGNFEHDNCNYFYFNYASIVSSSDSFEEALTKVNFSNAATIPCQKWDFDRSIYHSTIPTEFQLFCEKRWGIATIQSSYMSGGLIGTLICGYISDKYLGRRRTVLFSLTLVIVSGLLASFAKSYWMFLFLRIFISIGVSGSIQNCFVLIMEHSDIKYRALLGLIEQTPFAIGYMILPILAYFLRSWSSLQFAFGLISLSLISYYWILPNSPRWLATQGDEEGAVRCLLKIAKVNNYREPSREELLEIIRPCYQPPKEMVDEEHDHDSNPKSCESVLRIVKLKLKGVAENFKSLILTAEIRKRSLVFWAIFLTVSLVYYGLVFSANLVSNPFILVFLGGLMEIPAYTIIVPFVSKFGRRPTVAGTFIFTGICLISLSQTPIKYETTRIVLAMTAKLFISAAFAIIYVLGAELYPTQMRTTGLACGIFMGRLGAITAPYVADLLQNVGKDFPTVLFGISAAIAGLVSLGLPETGELEMVDAISEVEKQGVAEKLKEKRKMSLVDGLTQF